MKGEWEVIHKVEPFWASIAGSMSFQGPATDYTVRNRKTGETKKIRSHAYLDSETVGEKIANGNFLE